MLLETIGQVTQRTTCNFRVVASYAREAEQTAALLARALRRQGHQAEGAGAEVRLSMPDNAFHADIWLVLDETMLHRPAVRTAIPAEALLLVATGRPPQEVAWHLPEFRGVVATVDADGIAAECGADPLVAMLGAVARTCGCIDPDVVAAAVHNAYDSEHPYLAGASLRGCDQGYNRVHM